MRSSYGIACALGLAVVAVAGRARADEAHDAVVRDQAPPPGPVFLSLGVGTGGISGSDDEAFSQGISWSLQIGHRYRPQLAFVLSGEFTGFARYEMDPALSQQHSAITLGARLTPFGERRPLRELQIDPAQLWVRAGLGVGHFVRVPYSRLFDPDQGPTGPAATVGIGWAPIIGRAWALGFEATDSAAVYGDGVRHSFGINFLASLDL